MCGQRADPDPYRRAGLTGNPFRLDDPGPLGARVFADLGLGLAARQPLPGAATVFELVGPHGAGKSTHLLQWRECHPGPYRHVPLGVARWHGLPVAPICYWDEAYRAPSWVLCSALHRAAAMRSTIVCAGHETIAPRLGNWPFALESFHFPALSAETLQRFCCHRLESARRTGFDGALPALPYGAALAIAAACGASLRDASDKLHVWLAETLRQSVP